MSNYLNKGNYSFLENRSAKIYVDKSLLIKKTNELLGTPDKFMCVTRPRRFGKSMALSMLNAYYSKGCSSRELFKGLKIYDDPFFEEHLNKHNVIKIDMVQIYTDLRENKKRFVDEVNRVVRADLNEAFPSILTEEEDSLRKSLAKINDRTGERFIFLIDEWDVVFRESEDDKKLCEECLEFYRNLFKSESAVEYIDLVYMTGILPIRRYNSQSALNNFTEYSMLDPDGIPDSFGFTEGEVKDLCEKWSMDFSEVKSWYDGYRLKGMEIYNPRSVVKAMTDHECGDYWLATASTESAERYMRYDGGALKSELVKMLAGDRVPVNVTLFRNDLTQVNSRDAALTVLIHLGYLGYEKESKECFIPNREIADEIANAIQNIRWVRHNPTMESDRLLKETLKGNTGHIDEAFDKIHAELATVYNKNKEDVLSVITKVAYRSAREFYEILSEPNCPTGRADLLFTPLAPGYIPIIIELKVDRSPDEAIKQIKDRNYVSTFKGYHGKVMLLGIAYDSKTLKHHSKIEYVEL